MFATWYWDELNGRTGARQQALGIYQDHPDGDPFWSVPLTGPPQPTDAAGERIYFGGAMVLQMLREQLGDETFFDVLRAWTGTYRHRTATTADFVATASRVSGRDLSGFFHTWLYSGTRPALHPHPSGNGRPGRPEQWR